MLGSSVTAEGTEPKEKEKKGREGKGRERKGRGGEGMEMKITAHRKKSHSEALPKFFYSTQHFYY